MLNSDDLLFLTVLASSRSMASAALKLNVTPPTVSIRLQNLESKLGAPLVQRSGGKLRMTDIGQQLVEDAQPVLDGLEALNNLVQQGKSEVSGKISVVGPVGFGEKKLAPVIAAFIKVYPDVTIELKLSDCPRWDLLPNTDVMFYIGDLKDSNLIRKTIASNKRILCASPDYLRLNTEIKAPGDLKQHRCIALQENNEDTCNWRFKHKHSDTVQHIRIQPHLASNIADVVKCWALNGLGIIHRSEWDIEEEIASGALVEILPSYSLPDADIVALLKNDANSRLQKVNTFVEFVKAKLGNVQELS